MDTQLSRRQLAGVIGGMTLGATALRRSAVTAAWHRGIGDIILHSRHSYRATGLMPTRKGRARIPQHHR